MKEIKLSIIIPMYNGKKYIKDTVESLLPLECSKEIIIIDDGSIDESFKYCKGLWENIPFIKIYSKQNSGIVDTRNFGLSKAKGKYVLFSDHDDYVCAKTVDKAINKAESMGLDCVMWSTDRLMDGIKRISCDIVYKDEIVFEEDIKKEILLNMLLNNKNKFASYVGHVWSGLYARKLIVENNIQFKRFVDIEDDYLFVFDFLRKTKKLGLCKDVGYLWRYNIKSETYRQKYIENITDKYKKLYMYLNEFVITNKCSAGFKETFNCYFIQNSIVMAIENSFTCLNTSRIEKKEIKRLYKKYKNYFHKESIFPYEKRRRRIYCCLRFNLIWLSQLYIYFDSIYRKYKNKINK